jgi:hypothetical protein
MQRTPGSKLWLLRFPKEAEVHLKREASERGVDQERVMFTGKFADDEHLKVKRGASMLLDTLEYNAHVSGLDALWSGLPMVTLPGMDPPPDDDISIAQCNRFKMDSFRGYRDGNTSFSPRNSYLTASRNRQQHG